MVRVRSSLLPIHWAKVSGKDRNLTSPLAITNVIYDLWCNKCRFSPSASIGSDQYTGKTENLASSRFSAHKSDVNTGKLSKAVSDHFNLPGHTTSDMRFLPFEKITSSDPTLLKPREEYWIMKKKNLEFGINRQK